MKAFWISGSVFQFQKENINLLYMCFSAIEEHDYIESPYNDLEKELSKDAEVLKFRNQMREEEYDNTIVSNDSTILTTTHRTLRENEQITTEQTDLDYEKQLKYIASDHMIETQIPKPTLSKSSAENLSDSVLLRKLLTASNHSRRRRQIGLDANEGWELHYTTFNPKNITKSKGKDSFQV